MLHNLILNKINKNTLFPKFDLFKLNYFTEFEKKEKLRLEEEKSKEIHLGQSKYFEVKIEILLMILIILALLPTLVKLLLILFQQKSSKWFL